MKSLYLLFAFLIPLCCFAQLDCSELRTGTFELDGGKYGVTTITRTEGSQIESNATMAFEVHYDLTWLDPCTYLLKNRRIIKGDLEPSQPTDSLTAQAIAVNGNEFLLKLSANFTDFVTECTTIKIHGS